MAKVVKGTKEYKREYDKKYRQDPVVKQRYIDQYKKRMQDPVQKKCMQERNKKRRQLPTVKQQANERSEKWRVENPQSTEQTRQRHLKNRYGLTIQNFEAMLLAQNTQCAICKTSNPGKRGWVIDHDHNTGYVRGILCIHCNSAIGFLKDSPEFCRNMADYLEQAKRAQENLMSPVDSFQDEKIENLEREEPHSDTSPASGSWPQVLYIWWDL